MEQFHLVTSIERDAWHEELRLHAQLFEQLANRLPEELAATKAALEKRLAAH